MALAILGALLIGVSLGLLGAGGSILTVPVLAYLVGEPPKTAVTESLLIVAVVALAATVRYHRRGLTDWRTAVLMGVPGMLGSFQGAAAARLLSGHLQMLLFAAVLLIAAMRMLSTPRESGETERGHRPAWQPILAGIGIGLLTGLLGVGGGFLIVPALVVFLGVPMRVAVGTSLPIIVANSLVGFLKHFAQADVEGVVVRWDIVGLFAALGVAGSVLGAHLTPHIPHAQLRRGFGWFLVAVGVGTAVVELRGLLGG